ncbi:glycogen synthase GlgA [Aquibacillus rhizosphaerae]|uniref:Glycogen synthase n=1 Tax=Aquibacillus rhizosphaerae TaxID=3051431 RepID=A0ABT7L1F1_9BACI|nr:glycogen synthase GlgA [Aquibacillus sp. LR5S19]MDL4839639.1 glycogen synthase GlgA [Aquibacillus sp. LR5S19]
MNIVFIASEGVPFVKTGGLADVIGSLPHALADEGNRIQVFLPKHKTIPEQYKRAMKTVYRGEITLGWRKQYCGVEALRHDGINYYFIDNEFYFGRDNIYGYSDDPDEAERYVFFSKAVLEMLPHLLAKPDILHLHDWQTSIIPIFLQTHYKQNAYYQAIKTIFTIHNLKYQGQFSRDLLGDIIEISSNEFYQNGLEYYGHINLMKGAINNADLITTVSQTYAEEIQYAFFGEGLDGLLRKRCDSLHGIMNGISNTIYNPEKDSSLDFCYRDNQGKLLNKKALQERLGLGVEDMPILAMVTRLVEQKGLDLVIHVVEQIMEEDDIQMIILGTGEQPYANKLTEIANKYPHKFVFKNLFDEGLSRKVYAGADCLLMPSLFEPCGLSQLIALRYGTVPIVRETGGLKDTIHSYNEFSGEGNGFSFTNYNADDMLYTIRRAIYFYKNKQKWNEIINNGRMQDFSWKQSAVKYDELYQLLKTEDGDVDVF